MLCVGLTGPIACGKSTVANLFAQLGVTLIDTDQIARQITAKDQPSLAHIITHFGSKFLDHEGQLQRRRLRDYIFKHPQERLWLEQLLHPLIRQTILERLQTLPALYYMIEIPLLFCKTDYPYMNRVLAVCADPDMQIQRLSHRDQHDEAQAQLILKTQAAAEKYRSLADDILVNKGSLEDLEESVLSLHRRYCRLAGV